MNQTRKISTTVKIAQPGITPPRMMLRTVEASFPSLVFSFEGCSEEPMVVWSILLWQEQIEKKVDADGSSRRIKRMKEDRCCVATVDW